ncbi:MAG TPA: isochorismatase [Enterococcus sp.]|nr:isochorismatase [Enterococcus sp.]
MLVIIDMQNQILDPTSDAYVPDSHSLIARIAQRLKIARENQEYILHTRDIPIDLKDTPEEESNLLQIVPELAPINNEKVVKKYYYSIPPEVLIEIKNNIFQDKEEKYIEITGVETNICVLSNTIEIQSAFPDANFFIQKNLVAGKKHESEGLDILKDFNVKIIEEDNKTGTA